MGILQKILPTLSRKSVTTDQPGFRVSDMEAAISQAFVRAVGRGPGRSYTKQVRQGLAGNPYVYRCADLRASAVASLDPVIYDKDGRAIEGHPLEQVLRSPNPLMSWRDLVYASQIDYAISGNTFMVPLTTIRGLGELWPISPGIVTAVETGDIFHPVESWQVSSTGGTMQFGPEVMIHMHTATDANGIYGISPLEAAGLSIEQQESARRWNVSLSRNGAKPSLVIMDQNTMTAVQFSEFKRRLDMMHAGPDNAGSTMVLDGGKTIGTAGFSARDMDYAQGVTVSAREIAIAMGVPPELVGDSANKTYSNAQEANREFAAHTIKPQADLLYGALTRRLAPLYPDIGRIGYDEQQIDGLKGDESAIIQALTSCDFLTVNEKRARMSYDPVPGGDQVMTDMSRMPMTGFGDDLLS